MERPIIPRRIQTDAPVAISRPIVPRKTITEFDDSRAPVARPAIIEAKGVAPTAPRPIHRVTSADEFVFDEDLREQPKSSRVTLGDVIGDELQRISIDLTHRARTAPKIEEVVSSRALGLHYARPKSISVSYLRDSKPKPYCQAFSEAELNAPCPKIHYPEAGWYGPHAYIELADEKYATSIDNELGVEVETCHKGMSLLMTKDKGSDFWLYWPTDHELNVLNFPLRGKVTDDLYEASSSMFEVQTDLIVHEFDDDGPQQIVLVLEFLPRTENSETGEIEEGKKSAMTIVLDAEGKTHVVEIPHSEELFDDSLGFRLV